MDPEVKKIMKEVKASIRKARKIKKEVRFTLLHDRPDSLREVVKTKEQADFFMKLLNSL